MRLLSARYMKLLDRRCHCFSILINLNEGLFLHKPNMVKTNSTLITLLHKQTFLMCRLQHTRQDLIDVLKYFL